MKKNRQEETIIFQEKDDGWEESLWSNQILDIFWFASELVVESKRKSDRWTQSKWKNSVDIY